MPRPKKDYKHFSIRMQQDAYDRLVDYCERSGQSKTVAVERAILLFINTYDEQQNIIKLADK